jgi:quinol monooxygenase YgiN
MKRTNYFILASFILLFSCSSGNKETTESTETPVASTEPLFKVLMVTHPVANFDAWKPVYLAHDSVRQAYGISKFVIGRGMEDSNMVVVIDKITDIAKAKEFSALPALKEAMASAGVTGEPVFNMANVIRNDDTQIDVKDRVMISHKVKDFDAWLKVFDAEGSATRAGFGIIDRGLARDIDDPNKVYIVFAISDMEKAKARMGSEELKKTMTDAGVEGSPQFNFYRLVD